jgi:predicted O-methyltransferase YrrM
MLSQVKRWVRNNSETHPLIYHGWRHLKTFRLVIGKVLFRIVDIVTLPLNLLAAIHFRVLRKIGLEHFPATKGMFLRVGVFPVSDHYYEPQFAFRRLRRSLRQDRLLPGLDMNVEEQLSILRSFCYQEELLRFPLHTRKAHEFAYNDGPFRSGDCEYLYAMIRRFKPARILEIGAGHSTLMIRNAVRANRAENTDYACDHICIEPYEVAWLEGVGVRVIREKVETLTVELFQSLRRNDILFIDSSHIVRPQGDVLFLYQQVMPKLNSGVLIQVHDIFTPKDYLDDWLLNKTLFWNEQYILEALLTDTTKYRVIAAVNYLKHNHAEIIRSRLPILDKQFETREPGSFWIVKGD